MERIPVDSSDVAAIGYDDESQTLEVEFIKSGVYQYFGVPREVFEAFLAADSKGRFLAQNVKGQFEYSQM